MKDKALPHSLLAEVGILGSVMRDNRVFDEISSLNQDHFFNRSNRLIWQAITDQFMKGKPADLIALTEKLDRDGVLEETGGAHYISKIFSAYYTEGSLENAVEILTEKKKLREIVDLSEEILQKTNKEESKEILSFAESSIFQIGQSTASNENQKMEASEKVRATIERIKSGERNVGIKTGIHSYDEPHGGLMNGQMYVIAARPSFGKTSFGIQVTANLLMKDIRCLFISMEMSSERLMARMACYLAQESFSQFNMRKIKDQGVLNVEKALNVLESKPLTLVNPLDVKGADLRSIVRKFKRKDDIQFVCSDYLQKVHPGNDERLAIAEASKQLTNACVECNIPIISLCQLNRENDGNARPKLHHLKGSGQIEQDADSITLIWAEIEKNDVPPGEMLPVIFTIEKNRDGPTGDQHLLFDAPKMTFRDKAIYGNN